MHYPPSVTTRRSSWTLNGFTTETSLRPLEECLLRRTSSSPSKPQQHTPISSLATKQIEANETRAFHDESVTLGFNEYGLHDEDEVQALIMKVLLHNDFSITNGFYEFDQDQDGFISAQDLMLTAWRLNFFQQNFYLLSEEVILQWHVRANISKSGLLDSNEWCRALEGADPSLFEFVESLGPAQGLPSC